MGFSDFQSERLDVDAQLVGQFGWEADRTSGGGRLGGSDVSCAADSPRDLLGDGDCPAKEVDVTKAQRRHFAPAKAEDGSEPDHRRVVRID